MRRGLERVRVDGQLGARPDPAQLAEEEPHRHRPPSGERVECHRELGGPAKAFADRDDPAADCPHRRRQIRQPGRGAEVVADVAAGVEERDELLPASASRLADRPHVCLRERPVGSGRDPRWDAISEQGREERPALHLLVAAVDVDPELER